jgi:hypothetical protein
VAVAILAAVGAFFACKKPAPPLFPEEEILIVLGDFENRTGDPLLDDSLALAFRTGLEQARRVDVLSELQIRDALERMEREPDSPIARDVGVELCQEEGARAFVGGSIERVGSGYTLTAFVVDPRTRQDLVTVSGVAETQKEILKVLQNLVRDIRSRLD